MTNSSFSLPKFAPKKPGIIRQLVSLVLGFVAIAGFTAALAVLLRMMLQVTAVGGFCAVGGPYVIAQECSSQVVFLTPTAIVSLLVFTGLGAAAGGVGFWLVALAWPALFCTLGAGFIYSSLELGFGMTGFVVGGMFILMGAIPAVLLVVGIIRRLIRKGHSRAQVVDLPLVRVAGAEPTGTEPAGPDSLRWGGIRARKVAIPVPMMIILNISVLIAGVLAGQGAAGWVLGL